MLSKELAASVAADYRAMIRMAKYCESAEEYMTHLKNMSAAFGLCWYMRMVHNYFEAFADMRSFLNGEKYIYESPDDMRGRLYPEDITIADIKKCLQARVDWLHEKFGV